MAIVVNIPPSGDGTTTGPIALTERIQLVDVLRGLAVCGILIGNLQWFSGYGFMPPVLAAQAPVADRVVHFLVHFFIEGKFYSIFSFLFGFGFALQMARAAERGDTRASLFKRRLFWLLVIGLLHAYLFWAGDILSIYALMGFILVSFRKKSDKALLKWIAWLLAIPIFSYLLIYVLFTALAPPEVNATIESAQMDSWNAAIKTVPHSGYLDIIRHYNLNFIVGRYLSLIFEMRLPKILAMFLLGVYAYRRGFFQNLNAHRPLIRSILKFGLILGLSGNIAFAALAGSEAVIPPTIAGIIGVVTYAFGVPALALFYMALAATLWQRSRWRNVLGWLAPMGRMALSNYLMQTLICVLIFYGYGWGLYGTVGAAKATMIAFFIFLSQILLSRLWLHYFSYGPVEWIWRQLTYGRRLSIRKS